MRAFLGFAAIAATALTSAANGQTATFTHMHANPLVASLPHEGHHHGGFRHGGDGNDVRIHRGGFAGSYAGYGYMAYNDYSDFDGNRSFDPDKWNDWWHDRPDRAYPRWMSRNHDCTRPWYSGDFLTC